MPFLDFGISPEEGVKGPYADYDTALAALRADAGASDGDLYELDSGDVYVAQSIGSAFGLIPARWVDQISGDMSNASGSALRITGESKATTLARGWVEFNNVGTITESGDALRLDSSDTPSGYAQLQFTPTSTLSTSTGFLVAVTLQMVDASSLQGNAILHLRDGTKERRLHLDDDGAAGDLHWASNSTTDQGLSDVAIGTAKAVLFIHLPASGEIGGLQVVGDPRARCAVEYSSFGSDAGTVFLLTAYCVGGGAARRVIYDVYDVAIWELT
jgi:hypothetical protein